MRDVIRCLCKHHARQLIFRLECIFKVEHACHPETLYPLAGRRDERLFLEIMSQTRSRQEKHVYLPI